MLVEKNQGRQAAHWITCSISVCFIVLMVAILVNIRPDYVVFMRRLLIIVKNKIVILVYTRQNFLSKMAFFSDTKNQSNYQI